MNEPTEARLRMAGHWLQIGHPERTLDELQGLSGDAALDYRAYLFRGAALHALDRNAEAIDVLRDGLAQHGPFLPMLHMLGSALRSEGRLPEAEAAFLQGLSLDPNDPDLLIGYAHVCLAAGQAEKASALVERAASHAPESAAVSAARAQVAFALGKTATCTATAPRPCRTTPRTLAPGPCTVRRRCSRATRDPATPLSPPPPRPSPATPTCAPRPARRSCSTTR